jgi:hypothetical protein
MSIRTELGFENSAQDLQVNPVSGIETVASASVVELWGFTAVFDGTPQENARNFPLER